MPSSQEVFQQISRGLSLAARIQQEAQDPRLGLQRQQLQRQNQRDEQLSARQRQQDERQGRREQRSDARDDLRTRLSLASSGIQLSPEQQAARGAGEDVSFDLAPGYNVGSAGGSIIDFNKDAFFVPGQAARQQADLSSSIERQTSIEDARRVPLPAELSAKLGLPPGTRVTPSTIDDLVRAAAGPQAPKNQLFRSTDDEGNDVVVGIDPSNVSETGRARIGRKAADKPAAITASEQRLRGKAEKDERLTQVASAIFLEHNGDVDKAIADIPRQARNDESGLIRKQSVAIAKILRSLKDRPNEALETLRLVFGDAIPPELAAQLGIAQPAAAQPAAAQPAAAGGDAPDDPDDQAAAVEYLKRFQSR